MAAAVRVAVVAVLLMQCCGVIHAARPLLRDDAASAAVGVTVSSSAGEAAAGGAQHQVAAHQNQMKMSLPVPGQGNPSGWEDVNHHSASTTPVGPGIANNDSATPP